MASAGKEIDILLAGKTGNGKSATGNSILMKKAFVTSSYTVSATQNADWDYAEFEDRILRVVDIPGVGDTECTSNKGFKLVVDAMSNAVSFCPRGFHAILIVKPYDERFTREEVDCIDTLKRIFGEEFITKHAILCLTRGDDFLNSEEREGKTIDEWCEGQGGNFAKLYAECGKRVVLFDNVSKDGNIKKEQIRGLLNMIDTLTVNGNRYTNEIFQKVRETRESMKKDPTKEVLSDEIMREFGLINQQLIETDTDEYEENLKRLGELENRVDKLENDLLETYIDNPVLDEAMECVKVLKSSISTKQAMIELQIKKTKETEDLVREMKIKEEKMAVQKNDKSLEDHKKQVKERMCKLQNEKAELDRKMGEETEKANTAYRILRNKQIIRVVGETVFVIIYFISALMHLPLAGDDEQ